MKLTKQQKTIKSRFSDPHDFQIRARAGTGKTSTLIECAPELPTEHNAFVAFSKPVADHLRELLPNTTEARTIHSLGLALLKQRLLSIEVDAEGNKDYQIWKALNERRLPPGEWKRYIALCKANMIENGNCLAIRDTYDFDFKIDDERIKELTSQHLDEAERQAREDGYIDFSDMVWLAAKWGLGRKEFDCLLIDERQDLTPAQVTVCQNSGKRFIVVGDDRQAIFGWAGASGWKPEDDSSTLPLTVSWRCPASHIKLAQTLVPDIQARPKAPEGIIEYVKQCSAAPGDMVLCRTNAPLIGTALNYLRRGIPALVRGKDFGAGLLAIFNTLTGATRSELLISLQLWYETSKAKLLERIPIPTRRLNALEDRFEALDIVLSLTSTRGEAEAKLRNLFTDLCPTTSVVLSSIHRAKGLEASRIHILHPSRLTRDTEEEANITYVGYTRSKSELYFVGV